MEMKRIRFTEQAGSETGREVTIRAENADDFVKHGLAVELTDMVASVVDAIKKLRRHYGDTQPQFANRLGLSLASIVRYEAGSEPGVETLTKLAHLATAQNLADVSSAFTGAILRQNGQSIANIDRATVGGWLARIRLSNVIREWKHGEGSDLDELRAVEASLREAFELMQGIGIAADREK